MKNYRVEIAPAVKKQIERIPKLDKTKILDAIETLGHNPRSNGYKKLVGYSEFFRYRIGDYRIINQIYDLVLLVSVVEVANRRHAY